MLTVDNITKFFPVEGIVVEVLRKISFEVSEGEIISILGPSGCGKSTLLRCIGGYEKVNEGHILFEDREVTRPGTDRIMVFQDFSQLFPWQTVQAGIAYPLKVNGVGRQERLERANSCLKMVGLQDYASYYPHQLSGGMKQRVAIARALALKTKVLLMDEPFASLDAQTRTVLQTELIRIWSQLKLTILFVTHNIQEAIILGDRILVMSGGPGQVKKIFKNTLERPRTPSMKGFSEMWDTLYKSLDDQRFGRLV